MRKFQPLWELTSFARDRRGVAFVEFALTLPFLMALIVGSAEVNRYIQTRSDFQNAHATIAAIVSDLGDPSSTQMTTFSAVTWQTMMSMVPLLMPEVLAGGERNGDWWTPNGVSLTISWVEMTVARDGNYNANVVWSVGNDRSKLRPCNTILRWIDDTAPPDPDHLPASLRAPGSVVVVDLTDSYYPLFKSVLGIEVPVSGTSYFSPRQVSKILFDPTVSANSSIVAPAENVCAKLNQ